MELGWDQYKSPTKYKAIRKTEKESWRNLSKYVRFIHFTRFSPTFRDSGKETLPMRILEDRKPVPLSSRRSTIQTKKDWDSVQKVVAS